jgi:endonuclease/exonuclease/phosphatase family metal-dependent hydrolase
VATQNLWGVRGDWDARKVVLRDGLRELDLDIIAFQESIVTNEYDQIRDLVGDAYHVFHQAAREPDGQGLSIASRWEIGAGREIDLHVTPRTADFACSALIAEIHASVPIGDVLFVNHLPNWQVDLEYERELQTVLAVRAVEAMTVGREIHVILAGDLDASPDAASIRFLSGKQSLDGMSICYRDAWDYIHPKEDGHTFTSKENPLVSDRDWPFHRIDYLFVRCATHDGPTLQIADCAQMFNEPINGVWASDHFGVVANLVVPEQNNG